MADKTVNVHFLSQEELIEAGALDMPACIQAMEDSFKLVGCGDFLLSGPSHSDHGARIFFPSEPRGPRMPIAGPDRRFMALVGYLGGEFHIAGEKWYGSNIENPAKHSLPRSVLMIVLNDPDTCAPLVIMDGNLISAMRTGAVIGLGVKYLARSGADTAGIIGAGVISKTSLMALAAGMPDLKKVKLFDINPKRAQAFCEEMESKLGVDVYAVKSLEEAVDDADAVSTATAGSNPPVFKDEWFKPGSYFGLSADTQIEKKMWLNTTIVADYWPMHINIRHDREKLAQDISWRPLHWSLHQLIMNKEIKDSSIVELSEIVAGKISDRNSVNDRTIMATGGMITEDIAWAWRLYQKAREKGLGHSLKLWDQPYWT